MSTAHIRLTQACLNQKGTDMVAKWSIFLFVCGRWRTARGMCKTRCVSKEQKIDSKLKIVLYACMAAAAAGQKQLR